MELYINLDDSFFEEEYHEVLSSKSCNYHVEAFLGHGAFGTVARCRKSKTEEHVAVKILSTDGFEHGAHEAEVMGKIGKLNPDRNNMLKLIEHFIYNNHFCLVYELMDMSLYDFMVLRSYQPLTLNEIRVVGRQLLVALKALKTMSMVHGDIKPENIMLVNSASQPFKVKLIDFGIATETSNLWKQGIFQKPPYMSPEVALHLPSLDEGMDMWSLGCLLAYLYLGEDLYPYQCKYAHMRMILQINGQPDADFLDSAFDTDCFFDLVQKFPTHMWRLKSPEQYEEETGEEIVEHFGVSCNFCSLDDLKLRQPNKTPPVVRRDTLAFISLLKQMLTVNPRDRITASEALCHNFFTLKHLPVVTKDPYSYSAQQMMTACSFEDENAISIHHTEEESGMSGRNDNSDREIATGASLSSEAVKDKTDSVAANGKEETIKAPAMFDKHLFTGFRSGECETNYSKDEISSSATSDERSHEDASEILDFGNRTCDSNSSEEEISAPRAGTEEGDPAKQVTEKISVGEVKPVKKPFRGIRKFFSRLFKPVWTMLKKD